MIVVSILGILAAIVYPEFQGHVQQAKEAQAKANLKLLREAIERYFVEYSIPPGYQDNDPTNQPMSIAVYRQLVLFEKYLTNIPKNPFNEYNGMKVYADSQSFPSEPDGTSGWMYKPATREIRLNWQGVDSEGIQFFDY